MNIVLVIFDSLRKDCLGVYGSPPWGKVHTPHFDAFARESLLMNRAFPEALPTLQARRAIYTGRRVYPFHNAKFNLKGDMVKSPGWGPIPEDQPTLAEMLHDAGYRTGLIADVYHMFKPSKNFWRGFDQWTFLRGQEGDPARSGPWPTQEQLDRWLPPEIQKGWPMNFIHQVIMSMYDRNKEEEHCAPRVLKEAALWLEQNRDADKFFLTVESFSPHEPWNVPAHYREMYQEEDGPEQIMSGFQDLSAMSQWLVKRTQANYSAVVSMCDRWFGYLMESMRVLGLLDDTAVILTADHGHTVGDRNCISKKAYPSTPEVIETPLAIRFPGKKHAGTTSDMFVQHVDIGAEILDLAGVEPPAEIDGRPFLEDAVSGKPGPRNHVTIGWAAMPTVITDRWWFNSKIDGSGALLRDLNGPDPFARNVADEHPEVTRELFAKAQEDARGGFPDWLFDMCRDHPDLPESSDLLVRD